MSGEKRVQGPKCGLSDSRKERGPNCTTTLARIEIRKPKLENRGEFRVSNFEFPLPLARYLSRPQHRDGYGAHRARVVAQQKANDPRHALGRDPLGEIGFGHVTPVRLRVHGSGQDAVRMDIVAFQFTGEDLGKLTDRAFRYGVGGNACAARHKL